MKISFSSRNVAAHSFLELCEKASRYHYAGFEIYDAPAEKRAHHDSIFHSNLTATARRKLINRHIDISAISHGSILTGNSDPAQLIRGVELAARAGVENFIIRFDALPQESTLLALLTPALKQAEELGVMVLLETAGDLAHTAKVLDVLNLFASAALGVCWNIRESFFRGKETADSTIQILGSYVNFVRLGDCKDDTNVLLGEGELPVEEFMAALRSLNYDGYIACDWNDEITDEDIVLTHFESSLGLLLQQKKAKPVYYNRARTGTHPWKKYDLLDLTFSQVLDEMAERYPDQYCFKYTTLDYTRTYQEFRQDVDNMAASLISLGVKPGYHVAIWATNVPAWFITFWATVKIGAVLVTVNTAYKIHETEYLLRQSDTHTLVMIESCQDSNYKEIMQELAPELENLTPGDPLYAKRLPFLRNIVTVGFQMPGCLTWEQMLSRSSLVPKEEVRRRAAAVRPDDVCNMQYTSGTTGFPKGVMLTHRNIVNNGKIIGDRMDMSTADRMMIQVPMFHCFGMVLSMTNMMTHGGTMCPMPYFSPKSSLACIHNEAITAFNGVPTMFIAMFGHPDFGKTDFSHMRTGIMAGANCPADLMRRAAAEMNMTEILSVYGQTEASPGCTMGEVNEDLWHRVETVGSAFPGVECKIIDPETGEDLPDGENGEFVARGYNIMKGYYKMPKATASTIDAQGWLHTGDIACRTEDGYYKITGRLKDMIIRGGENLYPREIEEFYLTHPKVRDVQVVGVKDQRYGEEACAWIVLKKGEEATVEEMLQYAASHMAKHKVPRYILFVPDFPMNAAGKILKYKMKEQSEELLGLK